MTIDRTGATTSATMSVLLRLLAAPAADGSLVGQAEVVDTGELVSLHGVADLERLAQRLARPNPK